MSATSTPIALASMQPLAHMDHIPGGPARTAAAPARDAAVVDAAPVGGAAMLADSTQIAGLRSTRIPIVPIVPIAIGAGIVALGVVGLGVWAITRGGSHSAASTPGTTSATAVASATAAAPKSAAPEPPPPPAPSAAAALPSASASAEPAPAESAAPTAVASPDATLKFKCTPTCEWLECDGKKIELDATTTVAAGDHVCHAGAHGFLAMTEKFSVAAGDDVTHDITLQRLPAGPLKPAGTPKPKPKCGTFINPCK